MRAGRITRAAILAATLAGAPAAFFLPLQRACAQSVAYTDPVRLTNTSLLASSDPEVCIPFTGTISVTNRITAVTGSGTAFRNQTNLASTAGYYYYNGAWRAEGSDGTASYNDTTLPPTTYFTVRTVSTGTTSRTITDTLLTYDNTAAGINKSSSSGYYYYNGAWRLAGSDGTSDYGTKPIPNGEGFTIRKALAAAGATGFWQNTRNY